MVGQQVKFAKPPQCVSSHWSMIHLVSKQSETQPSACGTPTSWKLELSVCAN